MRWHRKIVPSKLTRREFIGGFAIAAGLAKLMEWSAPPAGLRTIPPAAAIRIGQHFLMQTGLVMPQAFFERSAFGSVTPARLVDEDAVRLVVERSRDDFLRGEIIDVGGYKLARTEVHFCAFEYLRSRAPAT